MNEVSILHIVESTNKKYGGIAEAAIKLSSNGPASTDGCGDNNVIFRNFIISARENFEYSGINSLIPTIKYNFMLGKYQSLNKKINQLQPAIGHIHGLWRPFHQFFTSELRRRKLKLVIQPHGMLSPWSMSQKPTKKSVAMWLYQKRNLEAAALLVATSENELNAIRNLGFKSPVAIIENGAEVFENNGTLTPSGNAESGPKIALFLSRLHPKKGLEDLIKAWAGAALDDWKLLIVGEGHRFYIEKLRRSVEALGVSETVQFLGPLYGESKTNVFLRAKLFVLPSYDENFGIAVLEALAHGVPVITTTETPWAPIVKNKCGWVVPVGVDSIRNALIEADGLSACSLDLYSRNARLYASGFSWEKSVAKLRQAYSWLLYGGERPSFVIFS